MSNQHWIIVVTNDGIYFIEAESTEDLIPVGITSISCNNPDSTFVNWSWHRMMERTIETWSA